MKIIIDPDVQAVAEFMQGKIPASKLVAIASALSALAPVLWGHNRAEEVEAVRLKAEPIFARDPHDDQRTQSAAIG
jgi:hypothetical protein